MIVVLAHTHPSVTSGGAEISAYTLYRGLRERGVACAFVAMCPAAALHTAQVKTDDEYLIPYEPREQDHFHHLAPPSVVTAVSTLLDRLGCTQAVFHHFLNFGSNTLRQAASAPGRRAVLVLHEFLAICHHHGQMVTRPAQRLCSRSGAVDCARCFPAQAPEQFHVRRLGFLDAFEPFDHFVSPSQFLKDRFVDWGLAAERIAVIENGVPQLPPPEPVAPARDAETPITIGFFGQINPFKGVGLILDAVEMISRDPALAARLRLRIHGSLVGQSAEFTARFEKLVATNAFLEFLGPYQNERVFELMRECDYVLMASTWWENSPVVIQEAYACGRPLIVPGLGGMKEKINDGVTGLHFRPGDARDLVTTFERASRDGLPARLRTRLPRVSTAADMAGHYQALLARLDRDAPSPTTDPEPERIPC